MMPQKMGSQNFQPLLKMENDFGQRRVLITRQWVNMIKPVFNKSKENYDLFYMSCLGCALRMEQYENLTGFGDDELQALFEKTTIRRWSQKRPGLIDVKEGIL